VFVKGKRIKMRTCDVKRAGSFPDEYLTTGDKSAWACIGNSVPPLFMRSIAYHILKFFRIPENITPTLEA